MLKIYVENSMTPTPAIKGWGIGIGHFPPPIPNNKKILRLKKIKIISFKKIIIKKPTGP
jgi:hypothetical protein